MKLEKRYGSKRLDDACERVLKLTSQPTVRNISVLCKSSAEKQQSSAPLPKSSRAPLPSKRKADAELRAARRITTREVSVMSNVSIVDQLREMRLSAMAKEFEAQAQDPATYSQILFEERFGLIVNAGWNSQQASKLRRRIRDAHFDIPSACSMEEIEYFEDRKLNREELTRLSTCQYIDEKHHIILKGATGSGKTYIACALGNAACRKFKRVRYVRMPELLDELTLARAENDFKKAIKAYGKVDLLILDEWLMRPLTTQQSYDLFEIIEARTKHGATIFCTQYDLYSDWYERLNTDPSQDSPISDAIMDRIYHNSYVVSVEGKVSMRARHGLKAEQNGEVVE